MERSTITMYTALATLLMALAGPVIAAAAADATADAAANSAASPKSSASAGQERQNALARRQANAKIKPVDINAASKQQLQKLPNISAADADKIIAGRPYGSKAWLVTKNIIAAGTYEGLKLLIVARQPNADGAKNAALYEKK